MNEAPSIRLDNVTLAYRRHPAVHHLSGTFRPGSFTAIVGPNGAGKSTLLKGITGEIRVEDGRIELAGIDRRDVAYLPQASELDRSFPITVADLVATGLWRRVGAFRRIGREGRAEAEAAIAAVGLSGFEGRAIGTLSGGQMQRALFARMLVQDARLLLLDEPFTAIDAKTTADLLALVHRWHGEGRTLVAVLHDFDLVRAHIPETLLIAREPVAWGPTAEALSPDNLVRARAMHEAFMDDALACGRAA
ncbi:zinc ABC transporter ATP-binding protein AztA [Prosthecomicrobium pneumaticum]|uniref:Zinc/manganese transport system ATP-binding protein n=1 Tax=Prosthecomicrobium pneumaticum TaxID=81895 RepID=A0A7W9FLD4_9HYPH|nr:zinc ABC transporter ATP-binding protein AztA [Prosthecomicrobium pneumaticum]MBB5752800.1 zinc/manganese transport system ATP-binding protein [Prosthecomicrobium pneumaticum]